MARTGAEINAHFERAGKIAVTAVLI